MTIDTPRTVAALALLVAAMRASGASVGIRDVVRARRALTGATEPYYAVRRTLCAREEDFEAFDAAYAEWFPARPSEEPLDVG